MEIISNITCIIAILYGGYLIISEFLKLYSIVFLKQPHKMNGTSFNYCLKSMIYYTGYAITGIGLGTIFLLYGCFRPSYEGPLLNINTMLIYLLLLISWNVFRANEEKIKIKYHT